MGDESAGQSMLSTVIYVVAAVEAVLACLGWFWKPRKKRIERLFSGIALALAIIGASTAQYTTTSLFIMGGTLCLLLVVFVLKSSFLVFLEFDKHVTQAHVLFEGSSKEELAELAKSALRSKGIPASRTARGLGDIARTGEPASDAPAILEAAGTVSVALGVDLQLCIGLLISLKRYFEFHGSYMDVADKLAVSAINGVQPPDVRQALDALRKERAAGPPLRLDEFLAALLSFRKREQDPELSGTALGVFINELLSSFANVGRASTVAEYAQSMLNAVDQIDQANVTLTSRSVELQAEITRRALDGERFLPTDDPLLRGLRNALLDSARALDEALDIADSVSPPEHLVAEHSGLVRSLKAQLAGTTEAREGVESADFGKVSTGLKKRGEGVDSMLQCALSLRKSSRGRKRKS